MIKYVCPVYKYWARQIRDDYNHNWKDPLEFYRTGADGSNMQFYHTGGGRWVNSTWENIDQARRSISHPVRYKIRIVPVSTEDLENYIKRYKKPL